MLNSQEREERRKQLGASEIYKLSNFDTLQAQYLWEEKMGKRTHEDLDNVHITAGDILEQPCLEYYSKLTGNVLIFNERIESPKVKGLVASLDAREAETNIPIENKVIGLNSWFAMYAKKKFNAEYMGTKLNIPKAYYLQVQTQIHVLDAPHGILNFNVLSNEQKENPLMVEIDEFINHPVTIARDDATIDEILKRARYMIWCMKHKRRPREIEFIRKEIL